MKKKICVALSYVLVAALAAAVTLFLFPGETGTESKLDQLEALIQEKFVDEVDTTAIEDAAADAMVEALGDRWSYYLSASAYEAYQEQSNNAYVGIGITIYQVEDGLEIVEVNENGPAGEAGLQVGDLITAIEGQSAVGMTTSDARSLVRGKEGTQVEITVSREGAELTLSVTRRRIQTQVAAGRMLEGNIGLVTIENFDSRCAEETIAAIEALLDARAEKLIFDVRNNPGGYASELVKVLDYLLPEGDLFRTVDYAGRENVDTSDADCLELPMAVLVNGDSYSAAEFFAAALSEYEAAVVVGEQTSGKGHFQNVFQLQDGSAVGLSVGKYYTPKGVCLEGVGITPDVEVTVDEETYRNISYGRLEPEEDPQIQAAVAALQ